MEACARRLGFIVQIEGRLTHGCRFGYLAEFLREAKQYVGTMVAVDGKKLGESKKIEVLKKGLDDAGLSEVPETLLWSVAIPSVEEWMMADQEAVPRTLKEVLGLRVLRHATRPGSASAERTAKWRLAQWTADLVGARLLQGGREYAQDIGRKVEPGRVGQSRNPDFKELLETKLPGFLSRCEESHTAG